MTAPDVELRPTIAVNLIAGKSVIHTFGGDFKVTDLHITDSGFVLVQLEGHQAIRPYYGTDVVHLVDPTPGGAR